MKLKNWALLLAFGLLLSVLVACGGGDGGTKESSDNAEQGATGTEDTATEGENVLNFVNGDQIPSMDPSLATDEYGFQFLGATMEGLYRLGENAQPVEGIAKDHEVSEDGLTWTFTLREDAVWSNGDPVTAHDFVYAWQRAVNPETGSEYGPYMMSGVIKNATAVSTGEAPVEDLGVKADGDFTLVVELENPTAYFESLTTFGTFLPLNQKFVEEQGNKFATSSDTLLANGPYVLEDWESTSNSWNLVKNEEYWDAETVQLDKMTYEVVKKPQTGVDLYEAGTVDRAPLSSDLVDQYATHEDYTVEPQTSIFYLKMNQTRNEALANKNIRAAISRAFNKEAIVNEILNNGSLVANGIIPADFSRLPEGSPDAGKDFREVSGDLVTYDVEKAQEYWEKGLEELGTDTVELELLGDDGESAKVMGEYLANQLSTNLPGLKVTLKNVPFEQRLDLDTAMDYDLLISGWGPDFLDPYTFLNLFLTDGENNKMGYSNPEYDELINATTTELATDNVARYENFLEAEKILFEDAAIAPIYQKAVAQLQSPKVEGVIVNPFGPTYEYKWASVGSAE
ncbi:peptide ABC transporter substrate-binding protein [Oceanobacillus sp. 143]|uniref:Peptide ABC transporter substrate-binding protein n=1 Tax=Oceanobacillus zhaokaii TaxID=2052660 RepID=A0A345PL47_9BACI|nr:peptide ABC transporter substrate-binding protein [Oceanobacillus zhaokaii]AXI10727.1 peptide ABC transporter substrate-binding protein [Oceanobacillus zhaokaii]QGS69657.1 peptide ABC transporter substrate-binding protein [Oceanobacillus sp. 143]